MEINIDNLTPAMRQYYEIKQRHPDALLMFRMGDFYEMFYEDAVKASKELEIVLTSRGSGDKKAPLAGIPYHALEPYLAKLVRKGYKVAICEQVEDPKKAKGIVKRDVTRIVTPGTVIEDSLLEQNSNNYIMCLYAYEDKCALAICDLSTGELLALDCDAEKLQDEITRFNPSECVMPYSLSVNKEIMRLLSRNGIFVTKSEDKNFSSENSRNLLLNHFQVGSLEGFGIENSIAINACGGLIGYLLETQLQGMKHISKIRKINRGSCMSLDSATIRNLEIVRSIRDGSSKGTLLNVLDRTSTSMGSRLLRKWLKAPLLSINEIKKRQNGVSSFYRNSMLREQTAYILKGIADFERIISRVNCNTVLPKELLSLRNSLRGCAMLKEALIHAIGKMLENKEQNILLDTYLFPDTSAVAGLIDESIREDASSMLRDGNIIKPEYDAELLRLHNVKSGSKEIIASLESEERQKTGIKNLKIGYNRVFGYYIEVSKPNLHLVPFNYIRKQTTANAERFVTEELKKEEELILTADEKIKEIEFRIFSEIVKKVSFATKEIQETADKVSVIDALCSLAISAIENNYAMPLIDDSEMIELKGSRHPVIEKNERGFVPNDITIGKGEMMLITGPNMAGKSTVMRQVALNVLMAQIGSFVAASEANIGIVDKIFTRVGAQDDIAMGQSTFMVEMLEVANILNNATEKSLIVLDEIGRGTSTFDGVSIAWSVAEHIFGRIRARTMFATHYHVLNKLSEQIPKIRNYSLAIKEDGSDIIFLRKLVSGGTDKSYGIQVARLAGVPAETLMRASEIQAQLEKEDDMLKKLNAKMHVSQKTLGELLP